MKREMAALSSRMFECKENMQLIKQRALTKGQKTDMARMYWLEEHVEFIAAAMQLLLELAERGM